MDSHFGSDIGTFAQRLLEAGSFVLMQFLSMKASTMSLLKVIIFASWCCVRICCSTIFQPQNIIHTEESAPPRSVILVNTPNYDLPEYFAFNDSISVDVPVNYYLNESMIYTYAFTNMDHSGTITVMFTEFSLDARSLIYVSKTLPDSKGFLGITKLVECSTAWKHA